jgi:hypothetical protein
MLSLTSMRFPHSCQKLESIASTKFADLYFDALNNHVNLLLFSPYSCLNSAKLCENIRTGPCRESQAGGAGKEESPDGSRKRKGEGRRCPQAGGVTGARSL